MLNVSKCLPAIMVLSLSAALSSRTSAQTLDQQRRPAGLDSTLARLYRTFSFEKGRAPDWAAMRSLFLDGATIVDPVRDGTVPHAISVESFIGNFRDDVQRAPKFREGFGERILVTRVDNFGHVAHAFVTFEGFVPGKHSAESRGVDSIQLILVDGIWKIASFTTQYEKKELPLPGRFLRAASGE